MHATRPHLAAVNATNRSAVSNRTRILDGVDGRSANARRFRDLIASYEAELGGNVSDVERDLIRQAAAMSLRGEQLQASIVRGEPVNNDELIRLSSTSKRLLQAIHAKADKRKAPADGTDLKAFLAARAAEKAA